MDVRPLGKTGLRVSELGVCLPPDREAARGVARRAAEAGVNLFVASDALSLDVAREAAPEAALVLSRGDDHFLRMGARDAASGDDFVVGPFNLIDQTPFAPAYRDGKGVIAVHVLKGGALAGRIGHTPRGALVTQYAPLVKQRRTLAQLAIQFALANEYVSSAVVRVSTPTHLAEALGALEAEPLTTSELEQIFETYANRHDPK
jgi:aryl-alcohol dehydrogenase-like predicted oxidoreductase